jgi:predicted PurR-regulated permease PerM
MTVALVFATAIVLAIALNAPVQWMENRGVPRPVAAIAVLLLGLGLIALVLCLVIPEVVKQSGSLIETLPAISRKLEAQSANFLRQYPELHRQIGDEGVSLQQLMPSMQSSLMRVGNYTLSLLGTLLFAVLLFTTVMYSLISPRPLIRGVLEFMPAKMRDGTQRALARGSESVVAWVWSNVIVGAVEATLVTVFCQFMDIPGAFVWGALAFFAELIPKIGVYIVSVPVILVSLSVSPMTALWTLVFFLAMNEVTGSFLAPTIMGRAMKMHPVSLLFAVLALGSAFGFLGAVLATPLAGFIKAFYEEFYGRQQPPVAEEEAKVETVLNREVDAGEE